MGRAWQLLSNPQAAEANFRNVLSVIDGCRADKKMELSHDYGLGKLFTFSFVCHAGNWKSVNSLGVMYTPKVWLLELITLAMVLLGIAM